MLISFFCSSSYQSCIYGIYVEHIHPHVQGGEVGHRARKGYTPCSTSFRSCALCIHSPRFVLPLNITELIFVMSLSTCCSLTIPKFIQEQAAKNEEPDYYAVEFLSTFLTLLISLDRGLSLRTYRALFWLLVLRKFSWNR